MSRSKVIVYKRRAGKRVGKKLVYYVGVWDEVRRCYVRRATEFTNAAEAEAQGWRWYDEGVPGRDGSTFVEYLREFWRDDGAYTKAHALDSKDGQPLSADYLADNRGIVANHIEPHLAALGLSKITTDRVTPGIIEGYKVAVKAKGLSSSTVNNALKAFLVPLAEYWRLAGRPERNPGRLVSMVPAPAPSRQLLTIEEAAKFFAHPDLSRRDRLVSQVAAFAGLRVGEACALRPENVVKGAVGEAEYYVIRVVEQTGGRAPKAGSSGDVPIPFAIGEDLLDYYKTESWHAGFIFDGRAKGTSLQMKAAQLGFNAAICAALDITEDARKARGLTFHSWRHWYVTYIKAEAGADMARKLARHRSSSMTVRYDDPTADQHVSTARLITSIYDRVEDARERASSQAMTDDSLKA